MIPFVKGHGLGNDYVVMNEVDLGRPLLPAAIVRISSYPGTIYQLRRGMSAMTMRIDGGPAVRIKVGR